MIDFTKPIPEITEKLTNAEIRQLRDYVFDRTISDASWAQVSHHWDHPYERAWLLQNARAMQTTRMRKK